MKQNPGAPPPTKTCGPSALHAAAEVGRAAVRARRAPAVCLHLLGLQLALRSHSHPPRSATDCVSPEGLAHGCHPLKE